MTMQKRFKRKGISLDTSVTMEPLKRRQRIKYMEKYSKKELNYHIWWRPNYFGINTKGILAVLRVVCGNFNKFSKKIEFSN